LIKLGCPFPFSVSWDILLQYWITCLSLTATVNKFYVLRDNSQLNIIQSHLKKPLKPVPSLNIRDPFQCLIPVRLIISQRGTIERGAVICIPTAEDLKKFEVVKNSKLFIGVHTEPQKEDENIQVRANLRSTHQKNLAFMRKKRKKIRIKADPTIHHGVYDSTHVSKCYNDVINNLWLPKDATSVLNNMSRRPIGFIEFGCETYVIGKCTGVGYCAYLGLDFMTQYNQESTVVLVRNCRDSLVYRFAQLQICTE